MSERERVSATFFGGVVEVFPLAVRRLRSSIINLTFAWHFLRVSSRCHFVRVAAARLRSLASVAEAEVLHSRAVRHTQWAPHTHTHTQLLPLTCSIATTTITRPPNFQFDSVEQVAYLCNAKVFLWHFYVVYRLALALSSGNFVVNYPKFIIYIWTILVVEAFNWVFDWRDLIWFD